MEAPKRRRSQVLRNKFFQEKQNLKDTHPHIVEMFDGSGSRALKTEIIENCFKKSEGKWKLDLDKPCFKEMKKRCV